MDKSKLSEVMSELGQLSAKKRPPEYFRMVQVKGVGARQKKSGRFEMITHSVGEDIVEHKKNWNCGLASCTEDKTVQSDKAVKSKTVNRTVKKTERLKSVKQKEVKKGELPDSMKTLADKLNERAKKPKNDIFFD